MVQGAGFEPAFWVPKAHVLPARRSLSTVWRPRVQPRLASRVELHAGAGFEPAMAGYAVTRRVPAAESTT
jgi:hypothetical protein